MHVIKPTRFVFISAIFLLSACGQADEKQSGESTLDPVEVEIDMPERADVEEKLKLNAKVTQAEEPVEDADEVLFELWKEGEKEASEEILAEDSENGMYTISKTFEEEGVFHVTAHVTARDMHRMPTEQLTIGNQQKDETKDGNDVHAGHNEKTSPVSVELQSSANITIGEQTEVSFQVKNKGELLPEGQVRYEVWKVGEDTRTWIDTQEEDDGVYTGVHTFSSAGEYKIVVHVENDEGLHEHIEETVSVEG